MQQQELQQREQKLLQSLLTLDKLPYCSLLQFLEQCAKGALKTAQGNIPI
jgi:hypothetical protein